MLSLQRAPIVAVATAPGRGAVGIVRVSGGSSDTLIDSICIAIQARQSWTNGQKDPEYKLPSIPAARNAKFTTFFDEQGEPIDQGLLIRFKSPNSYTGEDVLELQAHGGPVVLQLLVERCLALGTGQGLRLAKPGEFSERAYLNGKLDLAQAQGVADLIDASTQAAARGAAQLLSGALSTPVHAMRDALLQARMWVEANIDFPEEDIDRDSFERLSRRLLDLDARVSLCLQTASQGRLLTEGVRIVIAGQPNAGKSALLNALAGAEVAIVTPTAGTTRDTIAQSIQIEGVPIHLLDTAGLRQTQDDVERIGIARAWAAIAQAQAIVFVHDATSIGNELWEQKDAEIALGLPEGVPVIHVWTKQDLLLSQAAPNGIAWSVNTGEGVVPLRQALLRVAGWQPSGETPFTAHQRHTQALVQTQSHINNAMTILKLNEPALDLLAEELRLAHQMLGSITGEVSADDLLGEIFSKFCIGK